MGALALPPRQLGRRLTLPLLPSTPAHVFAYSCFQGQGISRYFNEGRPPVHEGLAQFLARRQLHPMCRQIPPDTARYRYRPQLLLEAGLAWVDTGQSRACTAHDGARGFLRPNRTSRSPRFPQLTPGASNPKPNAICHGKTDLGEDRAARGAVGRKPTRENPDTNSDPSLCPVWGFATTLLSKQVTITMSTVALLLLAASALLAVHAVRDLPTDKKSLQTPNDDASHEERLCYQFLERWMPDSDRKIIKYEFLQQQVKLALKAREDNDWAKKAPMDLFMNYVLVSRTSVGECISLRDSSLQGKGNAVSV